MTDNIVTHEILATNIFIGNILLHNIMTDNTGTVNSLIGNILGNFLDETSQNTPATSQKDARLKFIGNISKVLAELLSVILGSLTKKFGGKILLRTMVTYS